MQLRTGQTLIEVLVSLLIIMVGVLSLVVALINSRITGETSMERVLATQLAREPIEAARFIRDSNWLAREAGSNYSFADRLFSNDEQDPFDYTATYIWTPEDIDTATAVQFNFSPDVIENGLTRIYKTNQGIYAQAVTDSIPNDWTASPFSRFIQLYPICSSDQGITETIIDADGQSCSDLDPSFIKIGVQVISQVTWNNRGTDLLVELEERLYNWRYGTDPGSTPDIINDVQNTL